MSTPPASQIILQRMVRFFGDGGLVARYERLGDNLIQAGDIATLLCCTVPGLARKTVIDLLQLGVREGLFGRHGSRRTIDMMLNLDAYSITARGCYSLRPAYIDVEANPQLMRARRSVWVRWLEIRGWPVPPELDQSMLIEHEARPLPALPADQSTPSQRTRKGRIPQPIWEVAKIEATGWLDEKGCPERGDGGQAKLEQHIADWLGPRGYYPAESTVRLHVVGWIGEYRATLA